MNPTLRVLPAALLATLAVTACGDAETPAQQAEEPPRVTAAPLAQAPSSILDAAEAQRIAQDRHEKFEEIGKAFKAINDELKKPSITMPAIRDASEVIVRYAPRIPGWFPAGTGPQDGVRTDALPAVWEEPEAFRKAAAAFAPAAAELQAAAVSEDEARIRAAVKNAGQACKGCHDKFREEET